MDHLQQVVLGLLDHLGYAGLFVAMAAANIGAPIGSEVILPAAGALVATGHMSSLWLATAVAVLAELTGGSVGYAIGRYGGRPFVARYGKYVRFHADKLDAVDGFFVRYGTFAIFICRFIPVVRGVVAIPAGIARMNLLAFWIWTALGSVIFCGGFVLLGNALGKHLDTVLPILHRWALIIAIGTVVAVAAYIFIVWARRRAAAPEVLK